MEWSWVLNITAVKVRKRRASMQRKIISIIVTGGEKSLHSEKHHGNNTVTYSSPPSQQSWNRLKFHTFPRELSRRKPAPWLKSDRRITSQDCESDIWCHFVILGTTDTFWTDLRFDEWCPYIKRKITEDERKYRTSLNLTSPLDSDAGDELVSTESQSVTGDHSDVHLWTEELFNISESEGSNRSWKIYIFHQFQPNGKHLPRLVTESLDAKKKGGELWKAKKQNMKQAWTGSYSGLKHVVIFSPFCIQRLLFLILSFWEAFPLFFMDSHRKLRCRSVRVI